MSEVEKTPENTTTYVPLAAGTMVSHYRVEKKIGQGGMGEVYLAHDTRLNRKIALKLLPPQFSADKELNSRFIREAQAAARLDHPNIVTVHEVGEYQGQPFFAMSLVEGCTLKEYTAQAELSIEVVLDLILQIAEGLSAAHQKGIVHRDIKPSNIIVESDGRIRIVDFGLATLAGADEITKTGSTMGTFGYMSPEQVQGGKIGPASDVFSLGVIMFEILCRRRPFEGDNQAALVYNIVNADPPPIQSLKKDVPPGLAKVIDKALLKDAAHRYQNATELADDLRVLSGHHPQKTGEPVADNRSAMPSIAVLPFTNMSADPENEYFSDGISEEIINSLTQVQNLHVAARTSSFFFKNKSADVKEIGEKLQVETVLEGSVRKMGNKLRISAQLVDVANGYHLWSEKYDRTMDDIFAIQDEIASTITEKLKITLSISEKHALVQHGTESMQAYDLYLRGRFYWEQRGRKLVTGLSFYQKAVELDPEYALAYVGIGDAYHMMGLYGIEPPKECMPKAKAAALKALELQPNLAEAHTTLAMVSILYDRDWEQAKRMFERAVELNPKYVQNRYWYALWYKYLYEGDTEAALAEGQRGIGIDPLAALPTIHYAFVLWMENRIDDVLQIMEDIQHRDPIAFKSYWWLLGCCYVAKDDFAKALSVCPSVEKSLNRHQWSVAFHGFILAAAGQRDQAQRLQEELERRHREKYISNFSRSIIPATLGETDRAVEILATTHDTHDPGIILASRWPMLSPLRGDERFLEILRQERLNV